MSEQTPIQEPPNTTNPENQTVEPIKPRISLIKQWKILMKSIEEKTGINGYCVLGLILICVILVHLNIFESLITNLIGTVYPGFCTIKAIETKSKDKKNWLTYWLIFGSFLIVDKFAVIIMKIIPFYFVLKILFLIWMYLPGSNGSAIVYNLLLKKIFKYLETNVDPYMKEAKTFASTVSVDVTKKISGSLLKLKSLKKGTKTKGGDMAEALKASQELQNEEKQVFQSSIIFGSNPNLNNDDNSKNENLKKEEEKRKKEEEELKRKLEEEQKIKEEEEKRKKEEEEKRKQEEELKKKQEEEMKQKQIQEEEQDKKDNEEIAKLEEIQKNLSEMTKLVENNLENVDNKENEQKKEEQIETKEKDKEENNSEEKIRNEWEDILGGEFLGNDENKEENKGTNVNKENNNNVNNEEEKNNEE